MKEAPIEDWDQVPLSKNGIRGYFSACVHTASFFFWRPLCRLPPFNFRLHRPLVIHLHSSLIPPSFRPFLHVPPSFLFVPPRSYSFLLHSSPFLLIPTSFLLVPTHSSPFLLIPLSFLLIPTSFLLVPTHSSPFLLIPLRSYSFLLIPTSFLLVPPRSSRSSSFLFVPLRSSSFLLIPTSFLLVPTHSSSFLLIPLRSYSFLLLVIAPLFLCVHIDQKHFQKPPFLWISTFDSVFETSVFVAFLCGSV